MVRGSDERALALSSLRHVVSAALGAGQAERVQLRVVAGTAGRQILETAREARAQLIVLATRGSVSLLLGTVSQYVLRRAPCPVLVVPQAPGHRTHRARNGPAPDGVAAQAGEQAGAVRPDALWGSRPGAARAVPSAWCAAARCPLGHPARPSAASPARP